MGGALLLEIGVMFVTTLRFLAVAIPVEKTLKFYEHGSKR